MKPVYRLLTLSLFISFFVAAVLLAQSQDKQDKQEAASEKNLVFPKGDLKKGRTVFEEKLCHRCHTIKGEKFPEIDLPAIDHISLSAAEQLGWTRDDFAHHIMDPEHIISPQHVKAMAIIGDRLGAENSPMPGFYRSTYSTRIDQRRFVS